MFSSNLHQQLYENIKYTWSGPICLPSVTHIYISNQFPIHHIILKLPIFNPIQQTVLFHYPKCIANRGHCHATVNFWICRIRRCTCHDWGGYVFLHPIVDESASSIDLNTSGRDSQNLNPNFVACAFRDTDIWRSCGNWWVIWNGLVCALTKNPAGICFWKSIEKRLNVKVDEPTPGKPAGLHHDKLILRFDCWLKSNISSG